MRGRVPSEFGGHFHQYDHTNLHTCQTEKSNCLTHSLDQIDGQVEALDEFGVFNAGDEQLCHLRLQEVGRQLLDLFVIDLQLNCQK